MSACVSLGAGTPRSYADAFRRIQSQGVIDESLADHLVRAAGFRNVVAHAYESLDMRRVHRAAAHGPPDLRAFIQALSRLPQDDA